MEVRYFLALLFAFLSSCSSEPNIVDGSDVAITDVPYQVGIAINDRTWCGGSVISANTVLTAAHCVYGAAPGNIKLFMGSSKRRGGTQRTALSKKVHSGYRNGTLMNDIACLKIDRVTYSNSIKNVPLASGSATYTGLTAIASGWGKTGDNLPVTNTLQAAKMKIISNAECSRTFASIVSSKLCAIHAPETKTSTCQGDSGGPLVIQSNGVLVGVTSFTSKDTCEMGIAAGFARVTSYRQWIKDNCGV